MAEMAYKWAPRSMIPVPAQAVGDAVEQLRARSKGLFKPEMLVEEARPAESPLHPAFEWDDSVAAEKWRREQASHMVRSLIINVQAGNKQVETRAYVSVQCDKEDQYTSLSHALSDADMRAQVVGRALRELEGWQNRYSTYSELADVSAAIEKRLNAHRAPKEVARAA